MRASASTMAEKRQQTKKKKEQNWRENEDEEVDVDDQSDKSSCSNESETEENYTIKLKMIETKQISVVKRITRKDLQKIQRESKPKEAQKLERAKDARQVAVQATSEEKSAIYDIMIYSVLAITVLTIVAYTIDFIPEEMRPDFLYPPNTDDKFNYPKIFKTRLEEVQKLFPNQTNRFWKIIKVRGLAHLRNRKPSQPLVFMIGAPPAAHSVVNCIAKKLAWSLNPEMNPSYFIDGVEYSQNEGDHAKKVLDDRLEDIFRRGVRSALVMHLERLPPPSPLLFYKYCDNDEAPFKHAGIIFTVHLPKEPSSTLSDVEAEGTVETYLAETAWSKYPYESDSISALLSRIADTVVLASGETEEVLLSACDIK